MARNVGARRTGTSSRTVRSARRPLAPGAARMPDHRRRARRAELAVAALGPLPPPPSRRALPAGPCGGALDTRPATARSCSTSTSGSSAPSPREKEAMTEDRADRVLIVGAGPVGLGAALELSRCGVRSVLIEKHDTTSWHPKTRNFNTRTMEIARGWGPAVYKRLRGIDTPPGWKSPIRFLRTATGEEFGVIESKGFEGPGPDVSPAEPVMSSQELIEAILLDAVRATGMVDVRFATEATTLVRGATPADGSAALEVRSRATGTTEMLTGRALVAADGATSPIR